MFFTKDLRRSDPKKSFTRWEKFKRFCQYRLVVPLKRSVYTPKQIARGVMVGLAWGLTPTVGVQMIFCFFTWLITRKFFRWDFSLIVALAWTWITNVITLLPAYYVFFITGQFFLGRFDNLSGYNEFLSLWDQNVVDDRSMGYFEWVWTYTVFLVKGWGLPLAIGCLPWSALGAWVGYVWCLRFIVSYREARRLRQAQKLNKRV